MRVLEGTAGRRPTALEDAYQVFRLERQGNLVAPRTLEFYDRRVGELISWLRNEEPTGERVEDVGVNHLRAFRAFMTERRRPDGQPLQAGPCTRRTARFTRSSPGRSSTDTASTGGCCGCLRRAGRTRRRRSSM